MTPHRTNAPPPPEDEDPLVRSSRREAVVVGAIWLVALLYTVGYCTRFGYARPLETLSFILGFPDWVFWGILVPWAACTLAACWLSRCFMRNHDLEQESDDPAAEGRGEEEAE